MKELYLDYRHVWDIYTELLQNSADAIIEEFGEANISKGLIELEIAPEQRKIIITDNGIGIEESEISKILVNGKSLKREKNTGKFGFMGYGFTFVAFQSSFLKIESIKDGQKASRTYQDLYKFVYSKSDIPNSQEEEVGQSSESVTEKNGTKITVQFPIEFPNEVIEEALAATFRIAQSEETIKAVLRTRSIVGTLDTVFGSTNCFKFSLKISEKIVPIQVGYLTVREVVKKALNSQSEKGFYDREKEYEPFIQLTDKLSSAQKETALKVIVLDEKIEDIKIGTRKSLQARIYISATSKSHINTYNEQFLNTYERDGSISADFKLEHGCW